MNDSADYVCPRFANVEALAQLKRVIKPGSSLALLWNIEDCLFPYLF